MMIDTAPELLCPTCNSVLPIPQPDPTPEPVLLGGQDLLTVRLMTRAGPQTAQSVARFLHRQGQLSRAQVEQARRRLERLTRAGILARTEPAAADQPVRYCPTPELVQRYSY